MAKASTSKPSFRVLIGINYPPNKRAEPGDTITDLPAGSERALLGMGAIEPITTEED